MQERKYHAVLTAVRAAVALAALVPGPGLAAGPDVSDAVDMDSAEIFFESANGFIEGDMPDKRVFVAFSRRDGKSFAGMAWLPWKRGTFPRTLYIDTSRLTVKDNAIGGSLTLIAEGAPKHIYTLAGRIDGDEVYGHWTVESGKKRETHPIKGFIDPPSISRDPPFTDPKAMPTTEPWGKRVDVPHPFMLWTGPEAAAIRKRLETDPAAKRQLERTLEEARKCDIRMPAIVNLFKYMVLGDQAAGDAEKAYLLKFIGSHPTRFYTSIGGGRHFRTEENALRYDVLYDTLTLEQRRQLEKTFRGFIKHHIHEDYKRRYTRTNWLPNMQWPRPMSAHLMAVALGDEEAIRRMFHSVGGWKWYLDEYIADGYFYMEEFGKFGSMPSSMLVWCWGLQRIGLDKWGFEYTGKGGATMRRYLESLFMIGLPRVENPGGTPHYKSIHMGDASATYDLVIGYDADGSGGRAYWGGANMGGRDHLGSKVPKFYAHYWFEIAHKQWPDAHFDYFLAQMRKPGEDIYYPSLLFGVGPIDPKRVSPPPARSFAAPERGFAMLRAGEGPAYWTSPKPAVALQFGMYYVHYVHDCFTLIEYYAFNRPLYRKRQFGPHRGYAGGHPWRDTVRGHNGVVVDNKRIMPVDDGNNGCEHQEIRNAFTDNVKFVAVRSKPYVVKTTNRETGEEQTTHKALYDGMDMERALFLTDEYLFDVFSLTTEKEPTRPRLYHWNVHPIGKPVLDDPAKWVPTDEFNGGRLWDLGEPWARRNRKNMAAGQFDLKNVKKRDIGAEPWFFTTKQENGIGVMLRMLGGPGTTLYHDTDGKDTTTIIVQRRTPSTVFAALHEPFSRNKTRIKTFERIAQNDRGIAVRIVGSEDSTINDRVLLTFAGRHGEPITLTDGKERFTFSDHAYIRIAGARVTASGALTAMKLHAPKRAAKLVLNGKPVAAHRDRGRLVFGADRIWQR